jgi:CSLREA domain-containing protein
MRGIRAGLRRRAVLLLGASAVGVLVVTGVASAESFTVTTPSDSNDGACTASLCSLRDAVVAADQAGTSSTITLPDMNVDSSSFTDNDATTPPAIDPGQCSSAEFGNGISIGIPKSRCPWAVSASALGRLRTDLFADARCHP